MLENYMLILSDYKVNIERVSLIIVINSVLEVGYVGGVIWDIYVVY